MTDDEAAPPRGQRYRLAWKFRMSGASGASPWIYDLNTVEAWLESLSRRRPEAVEHWVEAEPVEPWR